MVHESRREHAHPQTDLPLLASLVRSDDFDLDLDALFEFGLQRLLDGVESWISR